MVKQPYWLVMWGEATRFAQASSPRAAMRIAFGAECVTMSVRQVPAPYRISNRKLRDILGNIQLKHLARLLRLTNRPHKPIELRDEEFIV